MSLILNKFEVGDIIVNLKNIFPTRSSGSIHCVLPKSESNLLRYGPYLYCEKADWWRKATYNEITAYYDGIRNINDIVFKKDSYIVLLSEEQATGFKYNYIYKQRVGSTYLKPYLDSDNSLVNGLGCYRANDGQGKLSGNKKWRYATSKEIEKYEELQKPYNVDLVKENTNVMSYIPLTKEELKISLNQIFNAVDKIEVKELNTVKPILLSGKKKNVQLIKQYKKIY